MEQLNGYRIRLVLVGFVAAIVLGGGSAKADFTFGEPTNLGPTINSASRENYPCITIDRLSLYFGSNRSGGFGEVDIWVTRRDTIDDDWGTPVNLGPPVNGSFYDDVPHISPDGLELYFTTHRPGSIGDEDIWISRRQSKGDIWSEPVSLGSPINTSGWDWGVNLSADGLEMYFGSTGHDGFGWMDLYVAQRSTTIDDWGPPVNIGPVVNSSANEMSPSLSVDGLVLLFCDHPYGPRPGGFGGMDIWMTRRPTKNAPWLPPENLGPIINSPADDRGQSISADGSILYFSSKRTGGFGGWDIYEAPIIPIVDLNGDGIVDAADMCIVVDHWGTDSQFCDVGPMPWGDGVVDVKDLVVFAEHLFEEYPPAESVEVNEDDNRGQVELERGQILVVTLESNPSTGYRWEQAEQYKSILLQLGEVEFKSSDTGNPPTVGAGGWEIFRFRAVSPGQISLLFFYHRSWEDAEPVETFSIKVTVN